MNPTSEPIYTVDVYTSRGVVRMLCYEDGCEFDVDMDFYTAHMDKNGRWSVKLKQGAGEKTL